MSGLTSWSTPPSQSVVLHTRRRAQRLHGPEHLLLEATPDARSYAITRAAATERKAKSSSQKPTSASTSVTIYQSRSVRMAALFSAAHAGSSGQRMSRDMWMSCTTRPKPNASCAALKCAGGTILPDTWRPSTRVESPIRATMRLHRHRHPALPASRTRLAASTASTC